MAARRAARIQLRPDAYAITPSGTAAGDGEALSGRARDPAPRQAARWKARREELRSKLVYKFCDAALTAALRPHRPALHSLLALLRPRSSNYDRVGAAVQLLDALVPGSARRVAGQLLRPQRLALAAEPLELIAYGSGSTVFALGSGGERRVLKVYRRSLGLTGAPLSRLIREFQWKYETVRSWYGMDHGLLPPAAFVVVHAPLLGVPAGACVQPYIEGRKTDLLADYADERLLRRLRSSAALRRQFMHFAERTLEINEHERACVDLLGHANVMLVEPDGCDPRMLLIDYGIFDVDAIERRDRESAARLATVMQRLRNLVERLTAEPHSCGEKGGGHSRR